MKSVPTYIGIRNKMISLIREGHYAIGEKLPSEYEMADRFKVSRLTWRNAALALEKEGYITIKRGIGSYISRPHPQIANNLGLVRSLTEMIQEAGILEQPSRSSISTEPATAEMAELLMTHEGNLLTVLDRVRMADDEPISHSINYLVQTPELDFDEGDLNRSLLRRLEQSLHIKISRSFTKIMIPDRDDPCLDVFTPEKRQKVLLLRSLHYDIENKPIFFSLDYLRNDLFEFSIMRVLP